MIESKQIAFNLFETNRREFLDYARWVAKRIYKIKGNVSTDDIRGEIGLPKDLDGRVFGAVFNRREWEKVGYKTTNIPTSHGRPVAVWILRSTYEKN